MEPLILLATQSPLQLRLSELSCNQQINIQPLVGVQVDHISPPPPPRMPGTARIESKLWSRDNGTNGR